jgi:hypothetical protein
VSAPVWDTCGDGAGTESGQIAAPFERRAVTRPEIPVLTGKSGAPTTMSS